MKDEESQYNEPYVRDSFFSVTDYLQSLIGKMIVDGIEKVALEKEIIRLCSVLLWYVETADKQIKKDDESTHE